MECSSIDDHRRPRSFPQNVPDRNVCRSDGELDDAGHPVILERLPDLVPNPPRECGIDAHDHRLDLLIEDRLHHLRTTGDHAEGRVRSARDARVGRDAEDDGAALDAQLVDRIVSSASDRRSSADRFRSR
jgi:hypothetical protein